MLNLKIEVITPYLSGELMALNYAYGKKLKVRKPDSHVNLSNLFWSMYIVIFQQMYDTEKEKNIYIIRNERKVTTDITKKGV